MRRGPGIGGLKKKAEIANKFDSLGAEIEQASSAVMQRQIEVFQKNLEEFASKHKDKINKNPEFRAQFQKLCSTIGVDPLASNKTFWTQALGVGDFYYEIAVQLIEICLQTRAQNGGLISMDEVVGILRRKRSNHRGSTSVITESDVNHALKAVAVLGNGFRVVTIGHRKYILSVPQELQKDNVDLLAIAATSSSFTSSSSSSPPTPSSPSSSRSRPRGVIVPSNVCKEHGWSADRVQRALDSLMRDGMCWVDKQTTLSSSSISTSSSSSSSSSSSLSASSRSRSNPDPSEWAYWVPSLWQQHRAEEAVAAADAAAGAAAAADAIPRSGVD